MKRALATVLTAVAVLAVAAAFVLWFIAIWTHGDRATRMSGSGFLCAVVAVAAALTLAALRGKL